MQQMAGHMNLLNPFVFNQFGAYGAYAQVMSSSPDCGGTCFDYICLRWLTLVQQQQQAALMAAAATAQGSYINPMAALTSHTLNGKSGRSCSLRVCTNASDGYWLCRLRSAGCKRIDDVVTVAYHAHLQHGRTDAQRTVGRKRLGIRLHERRSTAVPRT